MYAYEIVTRLSDLGRLDFSAQPVVDATLDDFDKTEISRLKRDIEKYPGGDKSLLELDDIEIERALRLVKTEAGVDTPTLTGMLLLGKAESLARLVPTHEAVFIAMQGTDNRANITYKQPLLYTIDSIVDAIAPWNPVTEVEVGLFSEPVPAYNPRAIREAIVNAFSHRDYSVLDRVRVQVDDAGLTIANPGGFIDGISIENLLTAEPHGRNNCLAAALKRIGLAESSGRGIDRIYEGSLLYGRPLPDYTASSEVRVNLFIAKSEPDKGFVRMLADEHDRTGKSVSLQALLVLDSLKRERRATLGDLDRELDIDTPRLKQTLEELVEAGIIEAVGSSKSRAYVLSAGVYKSAGKGKEYVRQTDIDKLRYPELIMKLVDSQGRITKGDVASLLHIPEDAAYYEIRKLKNAGELQSAQQGRYAYYIRAGSADGSE